MFRVLCEVISIQYEKYSHDEIPPLSTYKRSVTKDTACI